MSARTLLLGMLLLAPLSASAQDALPVVMQFTTPPTQKDYYKAGWVRVPNGADFIDVKGKGFGYNAVGLWLGVHGGGTSKWSWDGQAGGVFGGGSARIANRYENADCDYFMAQTTVGRQLYLSHSALVVGYAGLAWNSGLFEWTGSDGVSAKRFQVTSRAVATPVGVFANFGREYQVIPSLAVARVWSANTSVLRGNGTDTFSSSAKIKPYFTETPGVEIGTAKSGVYLGLFVTLTPALEGQPGSQSWLLRFTWALKAHTAGTKS